MTARGMATDGQAAQPAVTGTDSDGRTLADFVESRDRDLFAKTKPFAGFIRDWRSRGTYTYRRAIHSACTNRGSVFDEKTGTSREMLMLASNNYLGLNTRPELLAAAHNAVASYGTGFCGSPFLNGTYDLLRRLEERLARFEHCEEAMVFTSGYQANVGTISGLLRSRDIVLIDHLSHASIVDGCRLAGCTFRSFRHNDVAHLARQLAKADSKYCGKLIAVDGIFSMDGDLAPLPEIVAVAKRYGARVLVDEAHGTGVLGPDGGGAVDHFGLHGEVDIILGTFSKTLSSTGGFIASTHEVVNYVRHYGRAYMFSASPTPAAVAAALAALDVVEREPWLRDHLWANISYLHQGLKERGFRVFPDPPESAVIAVLIGADTLLREMSRRIHEAGVFLNSVCYPAVARDEARLRLSLMATHTRSDLDRVLEVVTGAADACGVVRGAQCARSVV